MGAKSRTHWVVEYCAKRKDCVGSCRLCIRYCNYQKAPCVAEGCNARECDCDDRACYVPVEKDTIPTK